MVLSFVASLVTAYLINRYATPIYPITASVLISEKEDIGAAEILYNNPLINPYKNYLNETYIIRSFPLVGSVVSKLNFDVAFYKEGNIKTTEAYDLPVKVRLLVQNGSYGASLIFKVIDEKSFSIDAEDDNVKHSEKVFHFNDSIEYKGHHFTVQKAPYQSVQNIKNQPYKLTFLNPLSVTGGYVNGLNIDWAQSGQGD